MYSKIKTTKKSFPEKQKRTHTQIIILRNVIIYLLDKYTKISIILNLF